MTLPVWFSSSFQLFLPLPMFWSSFFLFFFPSLSSLGLFFLSSVFFCFLSSRFSLLSESFFFPSVFFSLPSPPQRSWGSIYRAQGVALYMLSWGAAGWSAIGRDCQGSAPPSSVFWQVRGGWSAIVSGRWAPGERVAGKNSKEKKLPFFLLPRCMFGGEEER